MDKNDENPEINEFIIDNIGLHVYYEGKWVWRYQKLTKQTKHYSKTL